MNNGYRIEWSKRASEDFDLILHYLSENWGQQVIRKFVRNLDKKINHIQKHPEIYPSTSYQPGLRRCVVSKIHTFYYRIENKVIYIVTIWDNRSNNKGLEKILK